MSGSIVGLKLLKSDKMDQSDKYICQSNLTSYLSSLGTKSVPKFPALWDIESYIYKVTPISAVRSASIN